jgi:hypothetical protein
VISNNTLAGFVTSTMLIHLWPWSHSSMDRFVHLKMLRHLAKVCRSSISTIIRFVQVILLSCILRHMVGVRLREESTSSIIEVLLSSITLPDISILHTIRSI